MEFSERLKSLRKQAGLTQVDVAEELGIDEEKDIFRKELIEFMEERKKAFDKEV